MKVQYLKPVDAKPGDTFIACQPGVAKAMPGPEKGVAIGCGSCQALLFTDMSITAILGATGTDRRVVVGCCSCGAACLVSEERGRAS
jgi:hypothetical protein